MRTFSGFKGSDMQWVQPKAFTRHHELRSGQDVFATLTWVSVFGSLAEASSAEGSFTLKRGGFLRPYVTIRDVSTGADIAVLNIGLFRHGTLEFNNGRRITLVSTRFWGFEWEFIDENGQTLCVISRRPSFAKHAANVTISEAVRRDRDMLVMLIVGWYTMVLISDEAAASAAAAS